MDSQLNSVFQTYPLPARNKLLQIRANIFATATEHNIGNVEETLKWGEPSYLAANGSAVRIAWKAKKPEHYCVYFNCQTTIVETIKEVYGDLFSYDGNRALVFHIDNSVPSEELQHCLSLALRYHALKKIPLLGC